MSSISLSTAMSGISAANERLRASASSTASPTTGDLQRQQASAARAASVPPTTEAVEQQSSTYVFVANMRMLQTQVQTQGSLVDIQA